MWAVSVGDALSQLVGRFIFVRIDGRWTTWTQSANESISGAAYRHRMAGRFLWVAPAINWLFSWVETDHCQSSYEADLSRAIDVLVDDGIWSSL